MNVPVIISSPTRLRRGFTIIELLVAITITAAIAVFMVTIVVNVLNVWSRSTATLSSGNQARQILDRLSLDIEAAVLRRSSDVMFAVTIPNTQTGLNSDRGDADVAVASWEEPVKPANSLYTLNFGSIELDPDDRDLGSYRFGQAGVWLRFFTTPSDNSDIDVSNATAPRAVSYQIVRRRIGSNSSPFSYQLFRSEVRPFRDVADPDRRSTFEQGYDLFADNGYNDPGDANDGGTAKADPGTIRRPRSDSLLGNGVIDFGTRVFTLNDTGVLEEAFPVDRRGGGSAVRLVFAATTDDTKQHPAPALASDVNITSANTSYGYPAVVEVMVRILTPEGIEIIQAYEEDPTRFGGAAYTAEKWWELAEANSRVFTRRIEIRSTVN